MGKNPLDSSKPLTDADQKKLKQRGYERRYLERIGREIYLERKRRYAADYRRRKARDKQAITTLRDEQNSIVKAIIKLLTGKA